MIEEIALVKSLPVKLTSLKTFHVKKRWKVSDCKQHKLLKSNCHLIQQAYHAVVTCNGLSRRARMNANNNSSTMANSGDSQQQSAATRYDPVSFINHSNWKFSSVVFIIIVTVLQPIS